MDLGPLNQVNVVSLIFLSDNYSRNNIVVFHLS